VESRFATGASSLRIAGIEKGFLKGINVHSPESRDYCLEIIEFLRKTPIQWIRIHPLATRRLRARGSNGITHLDAIEKYAEAGFNLIIPIEVGVRENVGVISGATLRNLVDQSYGESFKAVKQIETRLSKYESTRIIYGIENEIDTKEWILQSMPNVAWRAAPLAWIQLSMNKELKFKRLANILDGIKDASPNSLTMVNVEADDPSENWNSEISFIVASQMVLSKMKLIDKDSKERMNNFRLDLKEAIRRLKRFDIVGLDNYPNYFTKIPPRGKMIGSRVDEIARLTRKPVINVEFGYTRIGRGSRPLKVFGTPENLETAMNVISPSPAKLQKQFFVNALTSIENSSSQGTFPWVLFLDPAHGYKPPEESGFSLLELGANRRLEPSAAMDYYLNWLDLLNSKELDDRVSVGRVERVSAVNFEGDEHCMTKNPLGKERPQL
jgi:hypothetical protein